MLFSVIVPVYNVEQYLEKCVNSILQQTYTDFELILVDDGSPDKCGEMCDEFAKKDKRIKVIHQKNGGVSAARNNGINIARGKYICFVDSDDWVSEKFLAGFAEQIQKKDVDILICGVEKLLPNKNISYIFNSNNVMDIKKYLLTNKWPLWVCNKCFNKKCFKDFSFPVGKIYEDAYFLADILLQFDNIVCVEDSIYFYNCLNKNSNTNNMNSMKAYQGVEVTEYIKNRAKRLNISLEDFDDNLINTARYGLFYDLLDHKLSKKQRQQLKDLLREALMNNRINGTRRKFWARMLVNGHNKICSLYAYLRCKKN